ncbi:GDP-mannose 4,6-dehydratase [Clostridia bacterium]|nr:GDP-mannose 4,6-dehydratase [Clostridia bacterium]
MLKRLLIFGVSGFVGPYLADEFYKQGYEVYGIDQVCTERVPPYVDFQYGDILDADSIMSLVHNIMPTHTVNLAAVSSVSQSWLFPQKTFTVNVNGAINILDAVRQKSPETRVLLVGSSEEYAPSNMPLSEDSTLDASNPYGISKVAQERIAALYRERYGLKIYYVRSFNHTGIGQSETFVIPNWCRQVAMIAKSKKPGIVYVGNTDVRRDFSCVEEVIHAYRLVIESDDCEVVYNIGSGKAIELKKIIHDLVVLSNTKIDIIRDSEKYRRDDVEIIQCDNTLLKTRLGWAPSKDITEQITDIYNYYYKTV